MSPQCVCVCVYLAHTHRPNTTSITSLRYPSLDSVVLFPSQKLPQQQPSKDTLHPSLSTHQQWRRNPSFGRADRGISCLSSSQRGHTWRESFTNWCLEWLVERKVCFRVCVRSILVHICLIWPFCAAFYTLVIFCQLLLIPDQVHVGSRS